MVVTKLIIVEEVLSLSDEDSIIEAAVCNDHSEYDSNNDKRIPAQTNGSDDDSNFHLVKNNGSEDNDSHGKNT